MHQNGKEQVDDTTKKAQERLNKIMEQVKAKGKALFNEGMESAKNIFEEKAQSVRQKASELGDKSVSEISDDVKSYVRRNPYKSIGIAVGMGVLLGVMFAPKKESAPRP